MNYVLLLTNKIYRQKQLVIEKSGLFSVVNIVKLVALEFFLGLISFPLYLGLKSAKVTAYFEEKGGYEKISFDYNLRRVLTLTGVGVIFFIWFVKLLLILLAPAVFGPIQLYLVSDLRSVDMFQDQLVLTETKIQTARVIDAMAVPEIQGVSKLRGGDYRFFGSGQPEAMIILFVSGEQTVVLTDQVKPDGRWQVDLSREKFKLSEGNHSVTAFNFDDQKEARSNASYRQYFKATETWLDGLVKNSDVFINLSIIAVIIFGILLTVLTI